MLIVLKVLVILSLGALLRRLEVNGKLRLPYDTHNENHFKILHNCVSSVIYRYYEGRTLMFFPNEINDSWIGVRLLNEGINATSAIKRKNRLKSYEAYHKLYILLPNVNRSNFNYYNNLVYKAEKSSFMLIIWPPNTPMEYVSKVHNNFWKFRLIKVASFIPDDVGNINIYVFFPFTEKSCGDGRIVQQIDKCTLDGFQSNYDIFSGIVRLLDFQGCTLKCYVSVQYPDCYLKSQNGSWQVKGTITHMLDTFRSHYNVSLDFHNIFNFTYNWYFYNTSLESVLREHENESYEFGVGAYSLLSRNDNPFIEYMFGTDPECIAWAVPSFAGDRPSIWMTLVSEFPLIVWCLIGLTIATGITFISVSKFAEDKNLSLINVIHISLMMIFAITAESPKVKSRFQSVKMFLFKWCLWGLVLRCAYEASLGSLLTVTVPAQELKSNKELLDRNFRVGGGIKMYVILKGAAADRVLRKLIKRFEILPPSKGVTMVEQIHSRQDLAVLQPAQYTAISAALFAKRQGLKNVVSVMKPCIINTFSSPMAIRKGSFMSELLTAFSTRIFESGLSKYWKTKDKIQHETITKEYTPLALQKLRGVFVFYFVGVGIATLVLAFETIQCKLQSRSLKKSFK